MTAQCIGSSRSSSPAGMETRLGGHRRVRRVGATIANVRHGASLPRDPLTPFPLWAMEQRAQDQPGMPTNNVHDVLGNVATKTHGGHCQIKSTSMKLAEALDRMAGDVSKKFLHVMAVDIGEMQNHGRFVDSNVIDSRSSSGEPLPKAPRVETPAEQSLRIRLEKVEQKKIEKMAARFGTLKAKQQHSLENLMTPLKEIALYTNDPLKQSIRDMVAQLRAVQGRITEAVTAEQLSNVLQEAGPLMKDSQTLIRGFKK